MGMCDGVERGEESEAAGQAVAGLAHTGFLVSPSTYYSRYTVGLFGISLMTNKSCRYVGTIYCKIMNRKILR